MRSSFEVVVVVFLFLKVLVGPVNSAQDPLLFQLKTGTKRAFQIHTKTDVQRKRNKKFIQNFKCQIL